MTDSFDPTKLDTRWHGAQSAEALTHPLMKGIDRTSDLGAAATQLMQELRAECLTLGHRDVFGPERTVVIREILNSLERAVANEVAAWRERTAPGAESENEEESTQGLGDTAPPSAEDSETEEGESETEEGESGTEDEDFSSDLDHYSRLVADLEGLLEIYLR